MSIFQFISSFFLNFLKLVVSSNIAICSCSIAIVISLFGLFSRLQRGGKL